jgi:hypothetical protein
MESVLKRVAMAVLGLVLTLGFWTVKGWFLGEASATTSHIPDKVWDGGGGTVFLEVETTDPARVSATFETNDAVDSSGHKFLETWEPIQPGEHTYKIEVPANVSGTVELTADAPKLGSQVRVTVKVDGSTVAEDRQTLTEPLKSGYAFFAQLHLKDYATGARGED